MSELAQFHFLRPGWLLLLAPCALLLWSFARNRDSRTAFQGVISRELLDHLLTRPDERQSRLQPLHLMAAFMFTAIIALAGPAWQRESAPFTEDQAALVIVLKVTPDMLSRDIQPSRLQRAIFKIHDLLELRPGTRNALIAYAGSAHLVMPLTTDSGIIETFAADLSPDLMPETGDEPARAVAMANALLTESGYPASIVLMADSIDASQFPALQAERENRGHDVHILAVAAGPEVIPPPDSPPAPPLDADNMRAAAKAAGGSLTVITADDADVEALNAGIRRSFAKAPLQEGSRWKDAGYYLVPVLILLILPFFRPGGAVTLGRRMERTA